MPTVRLTDSRVAAIKFPASGREEYADDLVTGLRLRVGASSKTWVVRSRAGSRVTNKKLGRYPQMKLAEARRAAQDFLKETAETGSVRPSSTFDELLEDFIRQHAMPRNKSWMNQRRRIEIHVLPHWTGKKLREITRADVIAVVDRLADQGANAAANQLLTLLRTMFKFAMRKGLLDANPADAIDKPGRESPRDRYLAEEEIRRVWKAAGLCGYPFGPLVKMLLLTAQRRTEVASMEWAHIDLENAEWVIPGEKTKNGKPQLVPLSPPAVSILSELPQLGPYVFTSDGETHVSGYARMKARLDAFIDAALEEGEEMGPWRLHDLRRTVTTHMSRLGIDESVSGKVLNHSGQGVTARHYNVYTYAEEKRHALNVWGAEVLRIVNDGAAAGNVITMKPGA